MVYSVDCAYLDYFKNAAEGMYDSGSPIKAIANIPKNAFDFLGKKDCLCEQKDSLLTKEHHKKIKTGHLGLLYHRDSLNTMTQLLA